MVTFNRRQFLSTAALSAAAAIPGSAYLSRFGAQAAARQQGLYMRRDIGAADAPVEILQDYRRAVTAMLQLPPTDPRNWYRQGLIHLLDCPHANWWFLPWHRAYLGWFEKICRDLSGNSRFALPYWNWSRDQRIPAAFFSGALDPSSEMYLASYADFKQHFEATVVEVWRALTDGQRLALQQRGYDGVERLLVDIEHVFAPREQARGLTVAEPEFQAETREATSVDAVRRALAPRSFVKFGSMPSAQHSQPVGSHVLESTPHNSVHGGVGGMMGDFLSPIDPIFYLHHANIDRIWDVWIDLQRAEGLEIHPEGPELAQWSAEDFAFFVDEQGRSVTGMPWGAYLQDDVFGYAYQQPATAASRPPVVEIVRGGTLYEAALSRQQLTVDEPVVAQVRLPAELWVNALGADGATLVMSIGMEHPMPVDAWEFHVFVRPNTVGLSTPAYAGKLILFGTHSGHAQHGRAVTLTIGLNSALAQLDAAGGLDPDAGVAIVLEARLTGVQPPATAGLAVHGMAVEVVG